jgi:hypothetical protein
MSQSKNDIAWEKIFKEYQIINNLKNADRVLISSKDINKIGEREARLMTKFDHKSQLPKLFTDNNLSILPVSRGSYIIGKIETFHDFTQDEVEIRKVIFPPYLESLDCTSITGEATAINCAFVSGIIQDFTCEENLLPTVNGRMSSSIFNFYIDSGQSSLKVNVNNAQVEIDAGYEGDNSLNLIEAKNDISSDFLVRQLFYPYKLWTNKISKKIRPIFMTYTNGIFHLREYAFSNREHYNSIELVNQKKYEFQDDRVINIQSIQNIVNNTQVIDEPEVPFPQADSFVRVINLCELLNQRINLTKEEITQNYDFDERQARYYANAAKYLELIECSPENDINSYCLTEKGRKLFKLSIFDRQVELATLILSHAVFKNTLKKYLESGCVPAKQEVIEIMCKSNLRNISSDSVYQRRSTTILSWIHWIINLIEA